MREYKVTNVKMIGLLLVRKNAEDTLRLAEQAIHVVRKGCNHKYIPFTPYDPTDKWFSSSCYCESCGKDGDTWWCPSNRSPNGLCNYDQPDGGYNPDNCIYCHQPDERK